MQEPAAMAPTVPAVETLLEALHEAVANDARDVPELVRLGLMLESAGRGADALQAYEQALRHAPGDAGALCCAARAQYELGRPLQALARLEQALALHPDLGPAWYERGRVLVTLLGFGMRRHADAEHSLRRAMALGVDRESVLYLLAAIGALRPGEPAPAASPRSYVEGLFDRYAGFFDAHLTGTLRYRVPTLIGAALLRTIEPKPVHDVVDLGCGTGLCGATLRTVARHLAGVDLSEGMLEQARRRRLYDELIRADLVDHLRARPGAIDVTVAADVLTYLGDLRPVWAGVALALRACGVFAFSIETHDGAGDHALQLTHRFAHAPAYVESLARQHGFAVVESQPAWLREDSTGPVGGAIYVVRKT